MKLEPWRQSGMLTFTRTFGQIGFRKNGTNLDIWIRVDGKPRWFSIDRRELVPFLAGDLENWVPEHGQEVVLRAESDGNAEETLADAIQRESGMEPAR